MALHAAPELLRRLLGLVGLVLDRASGGGLVELCRSAGDVDLLAANFRRDFARKIAARKALRVRRLHRADERVLPLAAAPNGRLAIGNEDARLIGSRASSVRRRSS